MHIQLQTQIRKPKRRKKKRNNNQTAATTLFYKIVAIYLMLFVVVLSCALAATTTTTTVLFCVQCNRRSSMPHVPLLLPPRVEFNCRCLVLLLLLLLIRIISCLLGCLPDSVLYLPRNVARSQFLTPSQRRLRCRTQCQSLGSRCCKQRESINRRTASMDRRLSKYF